MKITLKDLTKIYTARDGKQEVIAVNRFNFEIPDGQLVGLLGPSGCGKTTTLNLLSGLEKPTEGKILFDDEDVTMLPPEKRGIGLVFQNYALYPHLSVRQNIAFPLENLKGKDKLTKEEIHEKVLEAAQMVELDKLLERKPTQMSGGQQQRCAIARALVKRPRVLLLDEPLSNLDAHLRLQTREEIRKIQRTTGITTVFVTHDQEEAMSISDMIVVMRSGKVEQIGKPQEIYDRPDNLFVAKFLGNPAIHLFHGEIRSGKLLIDGEPVMDVSGMEDRNVIIGVRPEGFVIDPRGPVRCGLQRVEIMGRDTTVICSHPECQNEVIRAIIPEEDLAESGLIDLKGDRSEIRFSLKPKKVLLFDPETEVRL